MKTKITPIQLTEIASNSRKTVANFPESAMFIREEKVARSTRTNQPVCLTIVRDFQPDAVERL